jgi:plasmid stabilization system protein ParE
VSNTEPTDLEDLVDYLARTSRLERRQAERLVDEVLSFLGEQPEQFVRRRHLELQRRGLANEAIFERLERELSRRRFAAPAYTRRQLRRIVYG